MPLETAADVRDALYAYRRSALIGALTALGIMEAVHLGSATVDALAEAVGLDADLVSRLVRAARMLGLIDDRQGRLRLTVAGSALVDDARLARDARYIAQVTLPAWAALTAAVKAGRTPFEFAFGTDYYTMLSTDPVSNATWAPLMDDAAWVSQSSLLAVYPWTERTTIADIGGHHGALLIEILAAAPGAQGILVDLPHVVADAPDVLARAGDAGQRVTIAPADFFVDPLPIADTYLLSRTLYNWDDERAIVLLRRIRDVMPIGSELVLIEPLFDEPSTPEGLPLVDLTNFVLGGGRTRSRPQIADLLDQAGLRLRDVADTNAALFVITAAARDE